MLKVFVKTILGAFTAQANLNTIRGSAYVFTMLNGNDARLNQLFKPCHWLAFLNNIISHRIHGFYAANGNDNLDALGRGELAGRPEQVIKLGIGHGFLPCLLVFLIHLIQKIKLCKQSDYCSRPFISGKANYNRCRKNSRTEKQPAHYCFPFLVIGSTYSVDSLLENFNVIGV